MDSTVKLRIVALMTFYTSFVCQGFQAGRDFTPAVFNGLRLGHARVEDFVKKHGKPLNRVADNEGGEYVYYQDIGPVKGKVEIMASLKSQIVDTVIVYPDKELYESDIRRLFGEQFQIRRYELDNCLSSGGSAPLFESKNGRSEYMIYPSRGLAVSLTATSYLEFRVEPPGKKESQCAKKAVKGTVKKAGGKN